MVLALCKCNQSTCPSATSLASCTSNNVGRRVKAGLMQLFTRRYYNETCEEHRWRGDEEL